MTQVEDAKGVLQGLETKLSDARARHAETQAKAAELAYAAHTGDESARKKLDGLNAKVAMVAAEIASLEAAIVTAKRHVAAAEAAQVDEAERRKAREALALLDDFSQRGKLLDESLDKFVRQYDQLARDFRALQLLGYEPTSYPLVQINMQAAVATKLQFTDLRQNFLAPHARRDFISVIEGWARHIHARAEARLNRNAPGKKAA
jgi:chromosome segregation ATPase